MTKKILVLTLLLSIFHSFSQTFFEEKIYSMNDVQIRVLINKAHNLSDKSSIKNKKIIIPSYKEKSKLFVFESSNLSKEEQYNQLVLQSIKESGISTKDYELRKEEYSTITQKEKEECIFVTFLEEDNTMIAWTFEENEALPILYILLDDIDLSIKKDLRFVFNLLHVHMLNIDQLVEGCIINNDSSVNTELRLMKEKIISGKAFFLGQNSYSQIVAKRYASVFRSKAKNKTLLIPNRFKSDFLDGKLKIWNKISNVEYASEEDIEQKIINQDTGFYYMRFQRAKGAINPLHMVYFLSTKYDDVLYSAYTEFRNVEKCAHALQVISTQIQFCIAGGTTISHFISMVEDYNVLPNDLRNSKIGFLRVTELETRSSYERKRLNRILESKFKKYPFDYVISSDADSIMKCKYRLLLEMDIEWVNTGHIGTDGMMSTPRQEVVYCVVLKNNNTGEIYKFQHKLEAYHISIRKFIRQVLKMNQ